MHIPEWINRKTLLRAMLVAIGLSALTGVFIVVFPGQSYTWRLFLMSVFTAIAFAFMLPAGAMLSTAKGQAAGLYLLGLVVLVYTMASLAVWAGLFMPALDEQLAQMAAMTLLCGLPIAPVLRFKTLPDDRLAIAVFSLGSLAAAAFFATAIFGAPIFGHETLWETGFAILPCGVLVGLCLLGVRRQLEMPWRWIGVVGTIIATALVLYGVWFGASRDSTWVMLAYVFACTPAYMNLVRRVRLEGWTRWIRVAGVISFAITGFAAVYLSAANSWSRFEDDARVFIGLTIITLALTMAIVVLALMNRRTVAKDAPAGKFTQIRLTCPRCDHAFVSPLGDSACPACRLRFTIRVQIPVCPACQYDLSDVRGEKCPECGTAIPHASDVGDVPA